MHPKEQIIWRQWDWKTRPSKLSDINTSLRHIRIGTGFSQSVCHWRRTTDNKWRSWSQRSGLMTRRAIAITLTCTPSFYTVFYRVWTSLKRHKTYIGVLVSVEMTFVGWPRISSLSLPSCFPCCTWKYVCHIPERRTWVYDLLSDNTPFPFIFSVTKMYSMLLSSRIIVLQSQT